jgi:Skp family chaperone for outer membrane proteins
MTILSRSLVAVGCCALASCAVADDKQVVTSSAKFGVADIGIAISGYENGKIKEAELQKLQKAKSDALEKKREKLDGELKAFNAKKDTLTEDARKKAEQELMKASNELQNDVKAAQEEVRTAMNVATEELVSQAEKAAIEVAKAEGVDVLLEQNTGRVLYTKNGGDLTAKIQSKMNENFKLAQNKKPASNLKTVSTETKKVEKRA